MAEHRLLAVAHGRLEEAAYRADPAGQPQSSLVAGPGRVLALGGWTTPVHPLGHPLSRAQEMVVLEPEPAVRDRMGPILETLPVSVKVQEGSLEEAGFAESSFDTVVCTFALCRVADVGGALDELRRVLAPGGRLEFTEHVGGTGWRRRVQEAATPVWRRLAGSCRLDRDVPGAIRAAGWVITEIDRLSMPSTAPLPGRVARGVARPRSATAGIRPAMARPEAS